MSVKRRKKCAIISLVSILAILAIDQFSKVLVSSNLKTGDSIPIISNILHITYVKNTGAAFGLFKNSTLIFTIISVVAITCIIVLTVRSLNRGGSSKLFDMGLVLVLSGAMGNLIDRLRFSYVIDFIDVRIWPVFNIADTSITIGTFLLVISFLSRPPSS